MTREEYLRAIALRLVSMRQHLLLVACYRAQGLEPAAQHHLEQINRLAELLPLAMRRSIALARYVGGPAQRILDRRGVLDLTDELIR